MNITQFPSPNFGDRALPVDMLMMHYTGMKTGAEALERLCDTVAQVSAHYLVEEDGKIFQLVDETARAHHAGESFWRGERDNNSRSIGIELVNPGHEWGYRAFPDRQIEALIALSQSILSRHTIPQRNIVGHSDVAPSRKADPGELFPWSKLAQYGIGIAPPVVGSGGHLLASAGDRNDTAEHSRALLGLIGFDNEMNNEGWNGQDINNMIAFQRHFYSQRLDGLIDQGGLKALECVFNAMKIAK